MTICIRKASRGEAARAAALAIRMWEDNTLEDLTGEFRELIADQEAAVYLLYENDKPVAATTMWRAPRQALWAIWRASMWMMPAGARAMPVCCSAPARAGQKSRAAPSLPAIASWRTKARWHSIWRWVLRK